MKKYIVTADWHIKIRPDVDVDWQVDRYVQLIDTMVQHCLDHGAVLILAGDILDKNRPSMQELSLFIHLIHRLEDAEIDTYLISGNHESLGRGECVYDYLREYLWSTAFIDYQPKSEMCQCGDTKYTFHFVGHPQIGTLLTAPKLPDEKQILFSHFRATINQFIQEEIDVEKCLEPYELCFAGDIHAPLEFHDGRLIYTSAPVNSCFEAKPDCGYVLLTLDDEELKWERVSLDLPNLIAITCTAEDYKETVDTYHFYQIKVQGTPDELRMITTDKENVKLIKEPIVDHEFVEVAEEQFTSEVSTEKALVAYMEEMGLTTDKISQMMEVFQQDEE